MATNPLAMFAAALPQATFVRRVLPAVFELSGIKKGL